MRVSRTRFSKRRSKRKTEFPIVAVVQKKRKGQYLKSVRFGGNDLSSIKEQKNSGTFTESKSSSNYPLLDSNEDAFSNPNIGRRPSPSTNKKAKENQSSISLKTTSFRPQKKSRATIDYKNVILLRNLITAEGKILPRRISKLTAKQQRHVQKAIKSARIMGLIPFINKTRPF